MPTVFPKSKLLQFFGMLDKRTLLKMLLWVLPLKTLLSLFKTKMLRSVIHNKRLDVRQMVQGLQYLPLKELQQLMERITGQNVDKLNKEELLPMFMDLKKHAIAEGLKKMPEKHFREFIFQVIRKDPELMMSFPRGKLLDIIGKMPKPNMLELFSLLDKDMLAKFVSMLPDKMLALAVSQMDDKLFGDILMSQYQHLLVDLAAA